MSKKTDTHTDSYPNASDDYEECTIVASGPRRLGTGVDGGITVDVTVGDVRGQVEMLPGHDGYYGSWGERDHWVSPGLLRDIDERWGDSAADVLGDLATVAGTVADAYATEQDR
jgi:hypothetical protein